MKRLWKKTPEHLKQFEGLDFIAQERDSKSTFIPVKSVCRETILKNAVKYTTTYTSIITVPNVYLD